MVLLKGTVTNHATNNAAKVTVDGASYSVKTNSLIKFYMFFVCVFIVVLLNSSQWRR